jgi:hypothetical protein
LPRSLSDNVLVVGRRPVSGLGTADHQATN